LYLLIQRFLKTDESAYHPAYLKYRPIDLFKLFFFKYSKSKATYICVQNFPDKPLEIHKNYLDTLLPFLLNPSAIFDTIETLSLLILSTNPKSLLKISLFKTLKISLFNSLDFYLA